MRILRTLRCVNYVILRCLALRISEQADKRTVTKNRKKTVLINTVLIVYFLSKAYHLEVFSPSSMRQIIPNKPKFNFLTSKGSRVDMSITRGLHEDSRWHCSHDSTLRIIFSCSNGEHNLLANDSGLISALIMRIKRNFFSDRLMYYIRKC